LRAAEGTLRGNKIFIPSSVGADLVGGPHCIDQAPFTDVDTESGRDVKAFSDVGVIARDKAESTHRFAEGTS
jgi:hypothetical protein